MLHAATIGCILASTAFSISCCLFVSGAVTRCDFLFSRRRVCGIKALHKAVLCMINFGLSHLYKIHYQEIGIKALHKAVLCMINFGLSHLYKIHYQEICKSYYAYIHQLYSSKTLVHNHHYGLTPLHLLLHILSASLCRE